MGECIFILHILFHGLIPHASFGPNEIKGYGPPLRTEVETKKQCVNLAVKYVAMFGSNKLSYYECEPICEH